MARKTFTMSEFQYQMLQERYKDACERRDQTAALVDAAWNDLGLELGFYGDTARCILGEPRKFTAIAIQTVEQEA